MKNGVFKSDWFTGLVIVFIFLIFASSDFIASIERSAYDFGVRSSSRIPSDKIAIIAIDDQSIDNIGRWPWSRDIHAQMHDILAEGGAKAVGQTVFFSEPQLDPGLQFIRELKQAFEESSISAVPMYVEELALNIEDSRALVKNKRDANGRAAVKKISDVLEKSPLRRQVAEELTAYLEYINSAEVILDTDNTLAKSMKNAGNVIFYMPVVQGQPYGQPDEPLPEYVVKNRLPEDNIIDSAVTNPEGFTPLPVIDAYPPIAILGEQSEAIGASVPLPDVDGGIRTEPLVIDYYGDFYPSMALMLAAKSLNLGIEDIQITVGSDVQLGRLNIKTDGYSLMNTFFYHDEDYNAAFPVDSFYDVLKGKIPADKYRDKIVLIGATALGVGDTFVTPINPTMSPVVTMAHSVSSILNEDFFIEPEWGFYARMGALLLVALYIMLVLPKLGAVVGFIITSILLLSLFITHYIMMTTQGMWLQLMMPSLLLIGGHVLLTTKRFFLSEKGKARLDVESAESNRMLGLSLQGQGQLDMAFEKFRKLPLDKSLLEVLYNLALDYERKRQFNKAKSVYDYMAEYDTKFRDIKDRSSRAQSLEETVILGGGGNASPGGTLMLDGSGVEKPMLGRYEIERELGKGAMGAVYLGKDPKISRTVAIKTMALSQEFEEDELEEVKERFFREAETAGRLNHPNIVTIFDAGDEHDLAYIAMEFLKGDDLSKFVKKDSLLPLEQVLSLIKRSADGIDYAHKHNVVHRDIKPANIMWDSNSDTVKITDFGIARITDSSKTKTGLVLGTPSYMSPEQLAGKKVTGQSDIFSLGVMLFQMVTGKLPFTGDSMASLMFKIANEKHPSPESINPEVPRCVTVIINRAMEKDVEKRYQRGSDMVADINKCLKIIAVEKKV
ncbi:MAG: CHASE2 domain-containing protein [Gammaproteobacteria bacterium]|nr:CHASE2 domain-containing protein [Gammaproteobacteria bacterium]NNJ49686.1 CHASE2 domain-containing protein [Gammaproteobacteria bacterium]